ncbi:hypothetical protein CV102_20985 [Natronococcus pandeyae]|uniref:Uncharacterized protein n=1 Tax=Natronococcus pandeyae TaxID=2055836 RepID=A0A8J8PZY3_9EURY|nr:hypothetical protein [Natronococcus pandeyae]TYL36752.1 hypothetical protein CV102_20985 [Natronococcus pandeyae]
MGSDLIDTVSTFLDVIAKGLAAIVLLSVIWFVFSTNHQMVVLVSFIALTVAGLVGLYLAIFIYHTYIRP